MRRIMVSIISGVVFFQLFLYAVTAKKWEIRGKEEFLKGEFKGTSLSFEGVLSLSPKEDKLEGPAEEFFLSLVFSPEGDAFLGTGHSGKIYRLRKDGKIELYFQAQEMDVYCLALDKGGVLYAGTSPGGKIYKIVSKEKGDVFFNPEEKYIWDLIFTDTGELLAAVGESGGIYRINEQGEGSLIFKAEENHILCMKIDRAGNIIAGSGGKGVLYRISKTGTQSVIFESPYEEIKSLILDESGNVFLASSGSTSKLEEEKSLAVQSAPETETTITVTPEAIPTEDISSSKQPSAIYKVFPDGISRRLWSSEDELVYTFFLDEEEKRLIFGTGPKGRIYSIEREEEISLLVEKNCEQIYQLIPFQTRIYVLGNNPSSLSIIYPEKRFDGEYLSEVLDSKSISSWGRIFWDAEAPSGATIQVQTRSGNSHLPNQTWSPWSPPYQKSSGEQVLSPKARYLQLKVMLKTTSGKSSPLLHKISLFYLQENLPPAITKVELLAPNEVYLKPPEEDEIIWGAEGELREAGKERDRSYLMAKRVKRKGFQTLIWEASDENGDNLLYSVSIRKEGEERWRVLKERTIDSIYAFDTQSLPDGIYFLKVQASDALSNPAGRELKTEKISRPFIIDNSPPVVKNFQALKEGSKLTLSFSAEDTFSNIEEVKYLIRPGDWRVVFPEDGINDSLQENFKFSINLVPNSDNLITVRVKDAYQNVSVYRQEF